MTRALLAGALLSLPPTDAAPQQRLHLSPAAGHAWTSRLASAGGLLTSDAAGPDGRRIAAELQAEPAPLYALSVAWTPAPRWEMRLAAARFATAMELSVRASLPDGEDPLHFHFDGLGDVTVWLVDGGVQWRPLPSRVTDDGVPARPRVDPFLSVAAGITRWDIRGIENLVQLSVLTGDTVGLRPVGATLPSGSVGLGADVRIAGRIAARVEVADHVGADPLEDEDFALGRSFAGTVSPEDRVHTFRATLGVRVGVW